MTGLVGWFAGGRGTHTDLSASRMSPGFVVRVRGRVPSSVSVEMPVERDPYGFERFAHVARLRGEVSGACTRLWTCRNASIILQSQDGKPAKFQNLAEMLAFF